MKYLIFMFTIVQANIWLRIEHFFVKDTVFNFLDNNQINNCFYKVQDEGNLLLKCLRNNKLVDVSINIEENYDKRIITTKFI